jgi:hypothetical protein
MEFTLNNAGKVRNNWHSFRKIIPLFEHNYRLKTSCSSPLLLLVRSLWQYTKQKYE